MAKKKILIVDDEKDILLVLEKMLIAEGYSVLTADNGKDAITMAKSKSPDLIILDVIMPGMLGDEVAEKLKDHPSTKSIPVIFLTVILRKTEEYKVDHTIASNIIFAKPFDSEELLDEIKTLVETAVI
jgi:twitching motility two-component system response regulator PilH